MISRCLCFELDSFDIQHFYIISSDLYLKYLCSRPSLQAVLTELSQTKKWNHFDSKHGHQATGINYNVKSSLMCQRQFTVPHLFDRVLRQRRHGPISKLVCTAPSPATFSIGSTEPRVAGQSNLSLKKSFLKDRSVGVLLILETIFAGNRTLAWKC